MNVQVKELSSTWEMYPVNHGAFHCLHDGSDHTEIVTVNAGLHDEYETLASYCDDCDEEIEE